jgi:hypothetical protein
LRISRTEYLSVFDDLVREHADTADPGYDTLLKAYFAKSFIYGDSFSRAMSALGNEAIEVISNAELLQKTWAKENGVAYSDDNWVRDILWAQVAAFRPEVIFVQGVTTNDTGFLPEDGFRGRNPFVRCVLGFSGFEHPLDRLEGFDFIVSGLPSLQRHYAAGGVPTALIYHGFDTSLLDRMASREKPDRGHTVDFSFAGSTGLGYGENHAVRYWELMELCCATELDIWAHEKFSFEQLPIPREQLAEMGQSLRASARENPPAAVVEVLRDTLTSALGTNLPALPLSAIFPDRIHAPVFGLDMYDVLLRSRVTLNRHFDPNDGIPEIGNMRTFEATGIGTCMLVNAASNSVDLFEADCEIITYESVGECTAKANWLLEHEDQRAEIAAAGQRRTVRDHSIERRCAAIDEIIRGLL